MTASVRDQLPAMAKEAGAVGHLLKPFTRAELIDAVTAALPAG